MCIRDLTPGLKLRVAGNSFWSVENKARGAYTWCNLDAFVGFKRSIVDLEESMNSLISQQLKYFVFCMVTCASEAHCVLVEECRKTDVERNQVLCRATVMGKNCTELLAEQMQLKSKRATVVRRRALTNICATSFVI